MKLSEEQGTSGAGRSMFGLDIKLKGSTRLETAENYSILGIAIGVVMIAAGIGLTAISTTGMSALLAIIGSFVSFAATVTLILVWLAKELKSE
jgi:hypothetical protein